MRHVAGDCNGSEYPEEDGKNLKGWEGELPSDQFAQNRGGVIFDHSEECDAAVLQELRIVVPSGPCGQPMLHAMGHYDAMAHV